ncbi:hypothetical protein M0D69_31160 [Caballeronia sp. SEWSISQ10-4 2]|uniref:hypothetical protein n=1 Tax=Caballeronia sp. SEWSISQ10-4 2 TaxID=2937438 RepID=UPI00264CE595|nr:hypothetical protein [Caballeronia sp. SEWSISQ10-4 2]MDN7182400.1 hypothetical protein [Caballeronia sp. SEWSISQ10-4 2]
MQNKDGQGGRLARENDGRREAVRRANGLDFNESLIAGARTPPVARKAESTLSALASGKRRWQTQGTTAPKSAAHIDEGCLINEQQPELDAYYPLKAQLHAARVHS